MLEADAHRSLFLLHKSATDTEELPHALSDICTRNASLAALDSVSNMVVDAAQWYGPDRGSIMPICCYYNVRSAIEYMQGRNQVCHDAHRMSRIDCLMDMEKKYRRQWLF